MGNEEWEQEEETGHPRQGLWPFSAKRAEKRHALAKSMPGETPALGSVLVLARRLGDFVVATVNRKFRPNSKSPDWGRLPVFVFKCGRFFVRPGISLFNDGELVCGKTQRQLKGTGADIPARIAYILFKASSWRRVVSPAAVELAACFSKQPNVV